MLAGRHRLVGDLGVQIQRQSDDHCLDIRIGQELLVILVEANAIAGVVAVMEIEALTRRVGLALEDAPLIGGPNVAVGDEFEETRIVLADEDAPLVAGARSRPARTGRSPKVPL